MAIEERIRNSTVEFLLFTSTEDGASIEARYESETIWLTQKLMAELFGTTQQNISLHLKTIYADGELDEQATHKDFLLVQTEAAREVSRIRGTSGSHQRIRPADLLTIDVPYVRKIGSALTQRIHELLERARSVWIESAHLAGAREALLSEQLSGRIRMAYAA